MNVTIKIVDDKVYKKIAVDVLEFGTVAHSYGFDYESPEILCAGSALYDACAEATRQMDEYTRRGFAVDLQQDY